MNIEKPKSFESKSKFDELAETTKGKRIDVEQKIKNNIIEKFLHEYAQTSKKQSEVVKEIIEEYPDIDVCEILRPHADLGRD